MAQTLDFQIKGLHTYSSDINGVPKGSLAVARNINISRTNLAESRRGFDLLAYGLPNVSDRAEKLLEYDGTLLAHYGSTLAKYNTGSGWSSLGALSTPSNALSVKTAILQRNLYVTSSDGIKKLDSLTGSLYSAGLPKGLNATLALKSGTGTAVLTSKYVAYRHVICRYDENKNLIYGGVSSRESIYNGSGSTKDIEYRGYLPSSGIDTDCFIQLYRSLNSSATPNDTLQLCYEHPLTSTDISNGYFDIVDIVPDDLLGADIYTAESQESITGDNATIPFAHDIADFKGHLFFADIRSPYRFQLTLVACGGSNGLANNDTVTFSDGTTTEIYTAKNAGAGGENAASKYFLLDDASSSLSTRIDTTARSLVKIVNQESSLVYAYLLSTGENDLPGLILFESRSLGASQFNVVSSNDTPWSPQLQATVQANQYAENDTERNALAFSKYLEPEAVPLKNKFYVGSASDPIKRIVKIEDALFIFKEREGTFVLRGENEFNFSVSPLDSNARIIAPESLVSLNNQIYGLFASGIGRLDGSKVEYISTPVQDKINRLYGSALAAAKSVSFGVSYESDGKYILALPQTSADTYSTYQLIYDVYGDKFCEWDLSISCGFVSLEDEKLYLGPGDSNKIKQERKTFTYADFADFVQTSTLSAVDDTDPSAPVLTISGTDDMTVGDLLVQGDLEPVYIVSIDTGAGTVVVDLDVDWDTGQPVNHYAAIECEIEWNPEFSGNPAGFKHFSECSLTFNQALVGTATLSFRTDANPAVNTVSIQGNSSIGGWGFGEWDEGVWGGDAYPNPIRKGVPIGSARCNTLIVNLLHRAAYSDWQLSGIALVFEPTSTRVSR
jgi:hypothetical protein